MTTLAGTRCKYCWRPHSHKRRPGEAFHNEGCPEGATVGETEKKEWERGWSYGFADNSIPWWHYRRYSLSFLLGHRVGKAEINQLVEEAVEANNNYSECR